MNLQKTNQGSPACGRNATYYARVEDRIVWGLVLDGVDSGCYGRLKQGVRAMHVRNASGNNKYRGSSVRLAILLTALVSSTANDAGENNGTSQ
jgi:hypothetical protein